mgnify:CR=1 FL=1
MSRVGQIVRGLARANVRALSSGFRVGRELREQALRRRTGLFTYVTPTPRVEMPIPRYPRRRFVRRRMPMMRYRRRGRRLARRTGIAYKSRGLRVKFLGYRTRRLRGAAYRRAIFNHSRFDAHYRSIWQQEQTLSTAFDLGEKNLCIKSWNEIIGDFWTAGGGALTPTALGDNDKINLRGGRVVTNLNNIGTGDLKIRIYRLWIYNTDGVNLYNVFDKNANDGDLSGESDLWDPTFAQTEWEKHYKILTSNEVSLRVGETYTVKRSVRPAHIDVDKWQNNNSKVVVVVCCKGMNQDKDVQGSTSPVGKQEGNGIQVTRSHVLSYSVDKE